MELAEIESGEAAAFQQRDRDGVAQRQLMSEDVVGARLCGQASRACGSTSATSAAWPSVLPASAVTAISELRKRRE